MWKVSLILILEYVQDSVDFFHVFIVFLGISDITVLFSTRDVERNRNSSPSNFCPCHVVFAETWHRATLFKRHSSWLSLKVLHLIFAINRVKRVFPTSLKWRGRVTDCAPGRKIINGSIDSVGPSRVKSSGEKAEAEIISRHGVYSIIYYIANRAIKVNSTVPALFLLSVPPRDSLCPGKENFVEFTKLIVWRHPIFSWLYAQFVHHLAISCLTCKIFREISSSLSFVLFFFSSFPFFKLFMFYIDRMIIMSN